MNLAKIRENRLTASSNCMRKAKSSTSSIRFILSTSSAISIMRLVAQGVKNFEFWHEMQIYAFLTKTEKMAAISPEKIRRKQFLRLFAKMFSFARKGVAMNLRLCMEGAASCIDLEAVIVIKNCPTLQHARKN